MIYISTGGYSSLTASQVIKNLSQFKIDSFELSGGKYSSNLEDELVYLSKKNNFIVHNYFPPPEKPFVINLGSLNENIFNLTFNHIKKSIRLASALKSPYYSFHAGFLVDPQVHELGKTVKKRNLFDREQVLNKFINALNLLSEYSEKYSVKLLIENNVLTKNNLTRFENNPLLMVDIKGTQEIFDIVNKNVGLLIDVAHLKVSARTLNFDPVEYLEKFNKYTFAYHLSDNDGLKDTNQSISKNSWFWPYLRKDLDYYSLELYNLSPEQIKSQFKLTKSFLNFK